MTDPREADINALERTLATLEGRLPDRVPTFSMIFDAKPVDDTLGMRHIPIYRIVQNRFVQKVVDAAPWVYNGLSHPNFGGVGFFSNVMRANVKLGFDAGVAQYYRLKVINHRELRDIAGRRYAFCDDGFGGIYAMYVEGTIGDPESWKRFKKMDPGRYARLARTYFSFMNWLWGGKIALVASVGVSLHQDITEGMGFTNFVRWTRKDPGFVREIIDYKTELAVEAVRAVGQSGVKIMWLGDDLAYRSGSMLSPAMLEDLFGEGYKKIADTAHAGGVRIMFHTCGNVLDLLTMIADWGYDGVHALEPTAGVTIAEARRRVGNRLCLCGNVDITHTLVDATREEVFHEVKECIRDGAADGRFILAPTNSHNHMNYQNLRWMNEAAQEYGQYPIQLTD